MPDRIMILLQETEENGRHWHPLGSCCVGGKNPCDAGIPYLSTLNFTQKIASVPHVKRGPFTVVFHKALADAGF